jgi:hypothetical protein
MEKLYTLQETAKGEIEITPDSCKQDKDLLDVYTCNICLNIVKNPKACLQCDGLTCSQCIETILKTKNTYPNCRSVYDERKLSRHEKSILNSIQIICPNKPCPIITKYEFIKEHLLACDYRNLLAICQGCFKEIETTPQEVEIKAHVGECKELTVKCECCEMTILNSLLNEHLIICENQINDNHSACKRLIVEKEDKIKFLEKGKN